MGTKGRTAMLNLALGAVIVLHGLVHLLYFGQSARYFELQPGMVWPDGSWLFARLLSTPTPRGLAGVACLVAAMGLAAGGVGLLFRQAWWRPLALAAAAFSALLYLVFWDGQLRQLDSQGWIGILISVAILATALFAQRVGLTF
jgi:hypothetical protein